MNKKTNNLKITYEDSANALYKLLNNAIDKPILFVDDLKFKTALQSQGGIAELEGEWKYDDQSIVKGKISLNTLKKYSINLFSYNLDDGWDIINNLRICAKDKIEKEINKEKKPTKRTKTGLQVLLEENEDSLKKHKSVNFILLQALSSAMQTIQNISETSNKDLRLERAQVGLERIRAIVSLNQPPFNKIRKNTNVVSISGNDSDD